jgi:hypothetical protein
MTSKAKYRIYGSTEVALRDAAGRPKRLWNENAIGRFLRRSFGVDLQGCFPLGHWAVRLVRANTITNVGHAAGNGRISNQGSYNAMVNIALGTGTQGSPTTATALAAEITTNGGGRSAATASQVTTTVTNDTTQLTHTWTFTGSLAITEEGIFDSASASSGNMMAYQSFSAINVVNTDQLTVTHKYQT